MAIAKPIYTPAHNWLAAYIGFGNPLQGVPPSGARGLIILNNNQIRAVGIRIQVTIKTKTVSPGGAFRLYAAGSIDGVNFTDNYDGNTGGDFGGASVYPPVNSQLIATVLTPSSDSVVVWEGEILDSISSIPRYLGIIAVNDTGGGLDGTFDHSIKASYVSYEFV